MPVYTLTRVGIGKEATWGTAVSTTHILPVTSDPTFSEEYNSIRDSGRRGLVSMDYAMVQGGGSTNISLEGMVMPETIGFLLHGVMGTSAIGTAVSGVYPHTITGGTSVPSFTLEDDNPVAFRKYAGCKFSDLGISFTAADAGFTWTASARGKLGATGTATALPTIEYDQAGGLNAKPYAGIDAVVTLGGTQNLRVQSFDLSISRAQEVVHTAGSRSPYRIDEQPLEVTFSIVMDGASPSGPAADDLAKYIGFTEETVAVSVSYGTAGTARQFQFSTGKANYGDGAASRSLGGGAYAITLSGRCLHNTTDSGPCQFLIKNTRSTTY